MQDTMLLEIAYAKVQVHVVYLTRYMSDELRESIVRVSDLFSEHGHSVTVSSYPVGWM